jgi:hypothetical protein
MAFLGCDAECGVDPAPLRFAGLDTQLASINPLIRSETAGLFETR